jgi:hypothetical protein
MLGFLAFQLLFINLILYGAASTLRNLFPNANKINFFIERVIMEPFKLNVDTNTVYIRIIRFIGTLMLGFFIGAIVFVYKYEGVIDWINAFTGIACSLAFAFFPGTAGNQALIINDEGIFLKNYSTIWGKREYNWSSVKAVEVKKNRIELTKDVGSTDKIKLPVHTENQIERLKKYLQQLCRAKEIAYK